MRPRRSVVWGALFGALAAVGRVSSAHAACNGPYSPCFSADNSWPLPFFDAGLGSARLSNTRTRFNAGLALGYQKKPLLVVAASPDPYGTATPILDDWVTARALFAWRIQRFEFGMTLPFSLGGSGAGLAGATTRTEASSVAGVGAPHLSARVRHTRGAWTLAVTQELVLPVYTEQSFLGTRGIGYAPLLTAQWAPTRSWLSASLGARLRQSAAFGPVRFGSEGVVMGSFGRQLSPLLSLFVETWLLPALTRDEFSDPWLTRSQRRVPAEALIGTTLSADPLRATLGVGTSLPLTVERTETESNRFAGAPSPSLRVLVRLESSF